MALPHCLLLITALVVLAGCGNVVRIWTPETIITYVEGEPELPEVDLGDPAGGEITVRLWPIGDPAKHAAIVREYQIDLLTNLPGDGGHNDLGTPAYTAKPGEGRNNYGEAPALGSYRMPVNDDLRLVRFTGVSPGLYRARVKAFGNQGVNVSRPQRATGPLGKDQQAISLNVAQVLNRDITLYRSSATQADKNDALDVAIQPLDLAK